MPGMTCKASFRTYSNQDAVMIPSASVFSDDGGISHFVFVVTDGETEKRVVQLGPTAGAEVVVLEGLQAGQAIAKSRP